MFQSPMSNVTLFIDASSPPPMFQYVASKTSTLINQKLPNLYLCPFPRAVRPPLFFSPQIFFFGRRTPVERFPPIFSPGGQIYLTRVRRKIIWIFSNIFRRDGDLCFFFLFIFEQRIRLISADKIDPISPIFADGSADGNLTFISPFLSCSRSS